MQFAKEADYIIEHDRVFFSWVAIMIVISFLPVVFLSFSRWLDVINAISNIGIIAVVVFLVNLLAVLVFVVTRICFNKELLLKYSLRIILLAYFLAIIFFTNYYYCLHSMDDMRKVVFDAHGKGVTIVENGMIYDLQKEYRRSIMGTTTNLWVIKHIDVANQTAVIERENSLQVYLECLYFSISTITTTGYGDVYPASILSRVGAMMEMIAGQTIAVLALGAWFSSSAKQQ